MLLKYRHSQIESGTLGEGSGLQSRASQFRFAKLRRIPAPPHDLFVAV